MGSEIKISGDESGNFFVLVYGRGTHDIAPQLRDFAKSIEDSEFASINVDLGECVFMDSTFMGILAMLGLRARKADRPMRIYNAQDNVMQLLTGLGLKKLFEYVKGDMGGGKAVSGEPAPAGTDAQTVLEAHETLMSADESNIKRFGAVVDMVRKDIERSKDSQEQESK